uniref:Uncharacterized protein n=1 Tax=Glossina brevipalpis TaxID=37001 RepID=A0A1A9WCJ9_9MUSC
MNSMLKPGTGMQMPYTTSSSGEKAKSASEITSYKPLTPTSALRALRSEITIERRLRTESDSFIFLEAFKLDSISLD